MVVLSSPGSDFLICMRFYLFFILLECAVGRDPHSYANPVDEDPDVHRYKDRRPLEDEISGGRSVDDVHDRGYAEGPLRARAPPLQRPRPASEARDDRVAADRQAPSSADPAPRAHKVRAPEFDALPEETIADRRAEAEIAASGRHGEDEDLSAPPRRLEDREPRDWRAAPSLRRHRPAAPAIHESERRGGREDDDGEVLERRGRRGDPRDGPELERGSLSEMGSRRGREDEAEDFEVGEDAPEEREVRGRPVLAASRRPRHGFARLRDRANRDRTDEQEDREEDREEDRDDERSEEFDERIERWERPPSRDRFDDRLDEHRRSHREPRGGSLVDETDLSSDTREASDGRDERAAAEDGAGSRKRWTRGRSDRSDDGTGRDKLPHARPGFVYDWQEDGGVVDCPTGGCAHTTKNWETVWTWPYWYDGPGFKLALASIVALVFLYLLNCLNTSQPYVNRKAAKSGKQQSKRSGDKGDETSADPPEDFGPVDPTDESQKISRIRSIHQIETDSEDEDGTDESGDEAETGPEDERPAKRNGGRRTSGRKGRKDAAGAPDGSKKKKKSRAKGRRTGAE